MRTIIHRGHLIRKQCLLVVILLTVGCKIFRNPLLDIPIAPSGKTRSLPFRLYRDTTYWILIGLDPMQVDASACAAAFPTQSGKTHPPCHEVTPPYGPIKWSVTQYGKVIAQGLIEREPADLPRGRPNPWAKDKDMTWGRFADWSGHPGKDYVLEVDISPGSVDLTPFHPRVAIVEPL
jgi:hypothetical protein